MEPKKLLIVCIIIIICVTIICSVFAIGSLKTETEINILSDSSLHNGKVSLFN